MLLYLLYPQIALLQKTGTYCGPNHYHDASLMVAVLLAIHCSYSFLSVLSQTIAIKKLGNEGFVRQTIKSFMVFVCLVCQRRPFVCMILLGSRMHDLLMELIDDLGRTSTMVRYLARSLILDLTGLPA